MIGNIRDRYFLLIVAAFTAGQAAAQDSSFDCVMEPKSTVELQSSAEGILKELLVKRGARVKKGEVLARLDDEQEKLLTERARIRAQTDTDVRSARTQADFRGNEVDRLTNLRTTNAIPEKDYDLAVVEANIARLAVEQAELEAKIADVEYRQARDQLNRRAIKSPVEGVVVEITMFPGEYVHEQAPVITVAEINPLYVEVFVPVSRYREFAVGNKAVISPEAPIGGRYDALIDVIDNVFDAASRTFGVRLILPNEDFSLPGGVRCKVEFLPPSESPADGVALNES
jgi:RND family efflux transporter MFP subunit